MTIPIIYTNLYIVDTYLPRRKLLQVLNHCIEGSFSNLLQVDSLGVSLALRSGRGHAAQEDLQECHSLSEHMPSLAETDVVLGPDISHMAHYSARCMSRLDRFCPVLNLFNADQEGIVEKYHGLADWHKSLTFGPILPDRIEPLLLCEAPDDLPAPAPAPSSAEAVEVPAEEPVAEPVLQAIESWDGAESKDILIDPLCVAHDKFGR